MRDGRFTSVLIVCLEQNSTNHLYLETTNENSEIT